MIWDSDPLFNKAKIYIEQAQKHDPEDRFYVFWHFLAFEFLVKSALSKFSKTILAEPKDNNSFLFSLGFEKAKNPKQRNITALLDLAKTIIPGFKDEDYKASLVWMNFRNEEIHSGNDRLSEYATTSWLGEFYIVTNIFLNFLDKSISDLYGESNKDGIEKIISEVNSETLSEVKKEINESQIYYKKLDNTEKERVRVSFKRPPKSKVCKCPACNEDYAVIVGDVIKSSEPKLEDGELVSIVKFLPTELRCAMCKLDLKGYSRVSNANLGAEFTVKEYLDPVEILEIDIEGEYQNMYPEQFYDPSDEYMDE